MEKRRIKKLIVICSLIMVLICALPSVALAEWKTYSSTFPAYQGHVTVASGKKSLSYTTQATNAITGPSNTTCGYFWMDLTNNDSKITDDVYCDYGMNYIPYNGDEFTGSLKLRAKAATWSFYTYELSGSIDFG